MKFLFIIQGEGRGHLTQAMALQEILHRNGHEVVKVLVGKSRPNDLPDFFSRKFRAPMECFSSPDFLPKLSKKRINLPRSIVHCLRQVPNYLRSIRFLRNEIEKSQADRVINFYEALTGLTYLFHAPSIPQICIGHQYLFLHKDFVFPAKSKLGISLLKLFTQITCLEALECLALSFRPLEDDPLRGIRVMPPLLRKEVLNLKPVNGGYIHGYMVNPGYAEGIRSWHRKHPDVPLRFFGNGAERTSPRNTSDTLCFHSLDDQSFLHSLAGCKGYATTAGFESICEAMYLGKPVLMVPAHIEQDCNAFDAIRAGAGITDCDFRLEQLLAFSRTYKPVEGFKQWVKNAEFAFTKQLEKEPSPLYPVFSETPAGSLLPA